MALRRSRKEPSPATPSAPGPQTLPSAMPAKAAPTPPKPPTAEDVAKEIERLSGNATVTASALGTLVGMVRAAKLRRDQIRMLRASVPIPPAGSTAHGQCERLRETLAGLAEEVA